MKTIGDKSRRRIRRQNEIAKDLRTPKYKQRVKEGKPKYVPEVEDWYFGERCVVCDKRDFDVELCTAPHCPYNYH